MKYATTALVIMLIVNIAALLSTTVLSGKALFGAYLGLTMFNVVSITISLNFVRKRK